MKRDALARSRRAAVAVSLATVHDDPSALDGFAIGATIGAVTLGGIVPRMRRLLRDGRLTEIQRIPDHGDAPPP